MDKIKLFSYIIVTEIFVLGILLIHLFVDSHLNDLYPDRIVVRNDDIIYSKDKSIPFTGKMQDTLDNKFIVEFTVVNGLKQGKFSLVTLDGRFAMQGYMNKNKNFGNWKYYYECGQLECTGNFDNDEPTGKWKWFYQNSALKCEGTFINGKPDGLWHKYNEDGTVSMIINYRLGEVISFVQTDKLIKV
jgi:antitoxin component YwqK of YwqJK toxin-antitoxin module